MNWPHIRRVDLLWCLMVAGVRGVFFFHPLAWFSHWRLGLAQETAADELAIARQEHDPVGYGKLLVLVVEKFGPARLLPQMSVETVGSAGTLKARVTAMKFIGRVSGRVVVTSSLLLIAVVLTGLVPWRLVAAEPRPTDDRSASTPEKSSAVANPTPARLSADEAKAIAEIKRLGGKVTVHEKSPIKSVYGVSFDKTHLNDNGLIPVARLSQLELLDLSGTQVTDAGMESITALRRLQGLCLHDTAITDAGLERIKGLVELRELWLGNTNVTDAGLEYLKGLKELRLLRLHGTRSAERASRSSSRRYRAARWMSQPGLQEQAKAPGFCSARISSEP